MRNAHIYILQKQTYNQLKKKDIQHQAFALRHRMSYLFGARWLIMGDRTGSRVFQAAVVVCGEARA